MKALGSTLLEGRDLEVRRGEALALRLPVFALREGEILGLIGPNGAGKSTLLLCLAGLLPPTQGRLQFRGSELVSRAQLQAYRRRATLVFQEPLLLDTSVEANLSAGLRLRGLSRAERQRRVGQAAERFGITHLLDRPARDLSGGEAQRTSLARACALEPEVLLLDEPFSALDPPTREALLRDLGRTLAETGCTAVFATHDLMEALQLADTLMVLRAGEVTQQGPIEAVVNHPLDEFVATFVGMETLLTGPVVEKGAGTFAVALGGQRIIGTGEVDLGQELTLGIRPENVTLALHPESDTSARNQFQARVTRITSRGPFFRVELECGFFLSAYVTARSRQELGLVEGRPVFASFKATAVHLIRK